MVLFALLEVSYFWYFKETAIENTNKVSFISLCLLVKEGERKQRFFSYFLPHHWESLNANCLSFTSSEYLPLPPVH